MNQRARVTEYLIERLRLTFNDAMQGDEFGGSRRRPFGLTKEVARAAAADALEHFCAEAIEVLADDTFESRMRGAQRVMDGIKINAARLDCVGEA